MCPFLFQGLLNYGGFFFLHFFFLFVSLLSPLPLLSIPSAASLVASVSIVDLFYSFILFKALTAHPSFHFVFEYFYFCNFLFLETTFSLVDFGRKHILWPKSSSGRDFYRIFACHVLFFFCGCFVIITPL